MTFPLPRSLDVHRPHGPVRIPGSKSATNRVLLLAATARGPSILRDPLDAEDTRAMRASLAGCGVAVSETAGAWQLAGGNFRTPEAPLPVGASGTTLRFLIPWAALNLEGEVSFQGDPRLFERPLAPLMEALAPWGWRWETGHGHGRLSGGHVPSGPLEVRVDPTLSSQFLSGLVMALAGRPEGGTLLWEGEVASRSYLEMTDAWLNRFGCPSRLAEGAWEIPGGCLKGTEATVPGDWSGAAAFLCAAAVTGRPAVVAPLDPKDPQGDRALVDILRAAGTRVDVTDEGVMVGSSMSKGIMADLTLCPDLGPVLAATAAVAPGPSVLTGLQTLPLKECDRLEASAELVRWLGGQADVEGDHTLRIVPGPPPGPRSPFDPRNDHRMAFAAAVGALKTGGDLLQPGCVAKTYPTFWEAWRTFIEG